MRAPAPIGHIGITVPDVDAAARWYGLVLGWELLLGPLDKSSDDSHLSDQIRDAFGEPNISFRQAYLLTSNEITIEFFQFLTPRPTSGMNTFDYWNVGVSHLCVVEPEIDQLVTRIVEHGGRQRMPVRRMFSADVYRFCYCEDPYGNVIEITTRPHVEAIRALSARL